MLGALAATGLMAAGAWSLASRLWPAPSPRAERCLGAVVLAPTATVLTVYVLGALGAITPLGLRLGLTLVAIGLLLAGGSAGRAQAGRDLVAVRAMVTSLRHDPFAAAALAVGLATLGCAGLAAWLLPVWAWDALGYHLPLVYEALARRDLSPGPVEAPYLHTYPRLVELGFVAWAGFLDDDTFVDAAQLPWGVALWAMTAAMARQAGATGPRALAFGSLSLAVPVVALQLATNYVDVAVAALGMAAALAVSGPFERRDLVRGALALGLLLGSKPSVPPAVAALGLWWLVRAWRAGRTRWVILALVGAALVGGERYLQTALAHGGNPLWPVRVRLGPLQLPGRHDAGYFTNLGVPAWFRPLSWPVRVAVSWWAVRVRYVYDQRIGGFGPMFVWVLGPMALWALWRRETRRALLGAVPVLAFALTPSAFWTRYVLAIPCAMLAVVVGASARSGPALRAVLGAALVVSGGLGLARASGGFTDGAMSLGELVRASPEARTTAVSVDGQPLAWRAAVATVGPGEAAAHDETFGLPGLLWPPHRAGRVLRVPRGMGPTQTLAWIDAERVRLLVVGAPGRAVLEHAPGQFVRRFGCRADDCAVYAVVPRGR